MYYFIEIACVIAEMWNFDFLLGCLFRKRRRPRWVSAALYLGSGILLTGLSLMEDATFLRLFFCFTDFWLISYVLFEARPVRGFFASLLMCSLIALSDVLTCLLLLSSGLELQELMSGGPVRMVYLLAGHIVVIGLSICVSTFSGPGLGGMGLRILIPTLPCWLVSTLLSVLLAWQMLRERSRVSPLYLVVLLGLLYTNIIVIYYINRLSAHEREKREQELTEHHYAMQQEYYDQFRIQQEETRAMWHDIKKYLHAAQAQGEALAQVEQMLEGISCVVDVGNRVVSVILNEYAQAARDAGVRLELDIQVPRELFVTAVDLYVLLGNTLDNALEACASLPPDRRSISLMLKNHNSVLFYEIRNPYDPAHLTRVRGKMHGYGLRNVRRCVEKYNGSLDISQENNIFRVSAHLNSL